MDSLKIRAKYKKNPNIEKADQAFSDTLSLLNGKEFKNMITKK